MVLVLILVVLHVVLILVVLHVVLILVVLLVERCCAWCWC